MTLDVTNMSNHPTSHSRRCRTRISVVTIGTIWVGLLFPLANSSGQELAEARAKRIRSWIQQLDAAEYDARDEATRQLISIGHQAVEPLRAAVHERAASLEVATRGIYVLRKLGFSGDAETEEAAWRVLTKIAERQVTAAAQHAADAVETLSQLKQDRALVALQALGAKVIPNYVEFGMLGSGLFAVEFGEEWRGTEDDLKQLKWLRDVEQANFIGQQVTDQWLEHVGGMEGLLFVKIARARISDAALKHLKHLPQMRVVKLIYVSVGDGAVEHLAACRKISTVVAYGTRLSVAGAERLQTRGISVDRRKGAFLGIRASIDNNRENWRIDEVTPGSAAEKGGLLPGDTIVKYGDRTVRDFEVLQKMIAENISGDTVKLQVRRAGKIIDREITFGQWQ